MASSPPPSSTAAPSAAVSSAEPAAKRVVLPRCAAWFALDAISSLEKRLLPEFFEHEALHRAQFPPGAKLPSSKTPQIYMKYRNYMVHAYRQQPHVYLTATACRRNLAGDACAIMRVHEFLTHWGIINYDVPPHAMPPAVAANYALKPAASSPSSTSPLAVLGGSSSNNGGSPSPTAAAWLLCERCGGGDVAFELTSEAKRKFMGDSSGALPLAGFCLRPGSGICDDCYVARSLPDGVDATDFVRVQRKPHWSRDEDAKLLDAVSSSTASGPQQEALDWNAIAAKVQTKSADECVVRFLELPLLPRVQEQSIASASAAAAAAPSFAYAPSLNAAVVDMAALVRDVDPFVAKAAARAAIQAIHELHKQPPREVMRQQPNGTGVKHEPAYNDAELAASSTNGQATRDAKTDVEAAAAAVAAAGDAAGIVTVKTEPNGLALAAPTGSSTTTTTTTTTTTDDVEMAAASPAWQAEGSVPTTKETLAVVQEAAHATAAALLAARAHRVAHDTAHGPARELMTQLLQNQLQQLELKMQQVDVLQKALATERESLTRDRHALYMERLAFAQLKLNGGSTASL